MTQTIPLGDPFVLVAPDAVGMALFMIVMGKAFAALPVMTAGIGLPPIVRTMHGDPVVPSAIGMLSGFCGTRMNPRAADFDIVPAALLELPDRISVIGAQIPTGLILLGCSTLPMSWLVFRRACAPCGRSSPKSTRRPSPASRSTMSSASTPTSSTT